MFMSHTNNRTNLKIYLSIRKQIEYLLFRWRFHDFSTASNRHLDEKDICKSGGRHLVSGTIQKLPEFCIGTLIANQIGAICYWHNRKRFWEIDSISKNIDQHSRSKHMWYLFILAPRTQTRGCPALAKKKQLHIGWTTKRSCVEQSTLEVGVDRFGAQQVLDTPFYCKSGQSRRRTGAKPLLESRLDYSLLVCRAYNQD